jgi:ligand-binding sensor domain-containing protein
MLVLRYTMLFLLLINCLNFAQSENWKVYNKQNSGIPSDRIESIAVDNKNVKWFGTDAGLARFDGTNWTVYDSVNSPLPSSFINVVFPDEEKLWIGTPNGLIIFDGTNWMIPPGQDTLFTSKNIVTIVKDKQNNIWAAGEIEVVKFSSDAMEGIRELDAIGAFFSMTVDISGNIWVGDFNFASHNGLLWMYNSSNWKFFKLNDYENLISNFPYALAAGKDKNVWMGFGGTVSGGIVQIDDSNWNIYKRDNSGFPGNGVQSICIQDSIIWMGSADGLISFNGSNWELYDKANSGLPGNWIRDIYIDDYGNKWIGTIENGAAVFNENGIVSSVEDNDNFVKEFKVINYPNPFNSATTVSYFLPELSEVSIKIFGITGEKISDMYKGTIEKGEHKFIFNAAGLSTGIYFCRFEAFSSISNKKYQHTIKMTYLK